MSPKFYVYRPGTAGPTVKHDTVAQAVAEAERLAAKHPGLTFEILQILAITSTAKVQTFWMDGVIPPHICAMHRRMNDTCHVCGKTIEDA